MDRALTVDPIVEEKFMVPQQEGAVLAALDAGALILKREFSGDFAHLAVSGPASLLGRYRQYRRIRK
jgi:GTP-binding protein HflX